MNIAQISYRLSAELVNTSVVDPTLTPEGVVTKMKNILDEHTLIMGEYQRHKLEKVKKVGDLFIKCIYQLEYQHSTLQIVFLYIKPSDLWQIQSYKFIQHQDMVVQAA